MRVLHKKIYEIRLLSRKLNKYFTSNNRAINRQLKKTIINKHFQVLIQKINKLFQ